MVGLVVDDQQVAGAGHVAQHGAGVGFVALRPALVHAAPAGDHLVRLPLQIVAVLHQYLALPQLVPQAVGHNAELLIVVARPGQVQHFQPAAHRQAGGDDQHILRVARVLWIGDFVEHLPGDEHGHDDGLAAAGGHLAAQAVEGAAVAGHVDAGLAGRGRFGQPDERFDGFELAEEEAQLALLWVVPVGQQAAADARRAGVARLAPGLHPRPNLVHQRDFDEHPGVVGPLRTVGGDQVAGRAAAVLQPEEAAGRVVLPVARRLRVGGVDDQAVGLLAFHYPSSTIFRLSMPRSSIIFTAARPCGPAAKGSDSVPR